MTTAPQKDTKTETPKFSIPTIPRSRVDPPRFFEEDPAIWLVQLDLYFLQASVDDELSRFRIAATLLPGHLLRDFSDILRSPPDSEPYTVLCDAIRQRFGKSVQQRLRSLLSDQQLGDRRPSQFLRHLLDLAEAEGSQDSPLVRQIFMNAMPPRIQPFLQCMPTGTDLATIASTADRLMELPQNCAPTTSPGYLAPVTAEQVHLSGHLQTTADLPALMQHLISSVSALTTTVASLVEATSQRGRSSSRQAGNRQHRDRSTTPTRPTSQASSLCYYHFKFGANARSCRQPCSWATPSGNEQ